MYYKTLNDQITIQSIAVSDGESHQGIDVIAESRDRDHTVRFEEGINSWLIDPITMRLGTAHGVLISVKVRFDVQGEITFKAAAIHYRVG